MNEITKISNVYRTSNYSLFKRLHANRDVTTSRVNKIINSIKQVGYIQSPIIVNEKIEIIDGQGRYEALKRLGMPVDYIIVKGIGIKECRAMNIYQSNWGALDYIKSYAEDGDTNYIYLNNLYKKYKPLGLTVINNAVTGTAGCDNPAIKNRMFKCSTEDYERAIRLLDFEMEFLQIVRNIKGRMDYVFIAIAFAYNHPDVDNNRLYNVLVEKYERIVAPANIEQALEEISKIYNEKCRNKVYLGTEYRKYLDQRYSYRYERARHYIGK